MLLTSLLAAGHEYILSWSCSCFSDGCGQILQKMSILEFLCKSCIQSEHKTKGFVIHRVNFQPLCLRIYRIFSRAMKQRAAARRSSQQAKMTAVALDGDGTKNARRLRIR